MRRTRNPHQKRRSKTRAAQANLEREAVADRLAARSVVLAKLRETIERQGFIRWSGDVVTQATPELADKVIDAMMEGLPIGPLDAAFYITEELPR